MQIEKMWNLYLESNYHFQLTVDYGRMDRIVNLMLQVFFSHCTFSSYYFLVRTKQTSKKGVGREDAIQTNATFFRGGFL